WRILRSLNWTLQRPARRAKERNEEEIQRWAAEEWPPQQLGPDPLPANAPATLPPDEGDPALGSTQRSPQRRHARLSPEAALAPSRGLADLRAGAQPGGVRLGQRQGQGTGEPVCRGDARRRGGHEAGVALDGRTTRHCGYQVSQRMRKRVKREDVATRSR